MYSKIGIGFIKKQWVPIAFLTAVTLVFGIVVFANDYSSLNHTNNTNGSGTTVQVPIVLVDQSNGPFTIQSITKSRNEYNLSFSSGDVFSGSGILTVSSVTRPGFISIQVRDASANVDSLILRINPSAPTTILPSLAPASVSGGTVSFSVTDTETTENDITDFGTGFFQNNLVASNGNNIFSINTGNIEQRSLSNERQSRFSQTDDIGGKKSLEFYSAANTLLSIDLTLATKIKSYGNSISIRLNDGRVFNGFPSGGYLRMDQSANKSDIGIIEGSLSDPMPAFVIDSSVIDYEFVGGRYFIMTPTVMKMYISTPYSPSGYELAWSVSNPGAKGFYLDGGVVMVSQNGHSWSLDNDSIIYIITDEIGRTAYMGVKKNFTDLASSYRSSSSIPTLTSLTSKTVTDLITNLTGAVAPTDGVSVYSDTKFFIKNISTTDFTQTIISKTFSVKKDSSVLGVSQTVQPVINVTVPIIGFGIAFSSSSGSVNPNPNVGVGNQSSKGFDLVDGTYYLHIKAFDFSQNSSSEIIKGPFRIISSPVKIFAPSVRTNTSSGGYDVTFSFRADNILDDGTIAIPNSILYVKSFDSIGSSIGTETPIPFSQISRVYDAGANASSYYWSAKKSGVAYMVRFHVSSSNLAMVQFHIVGKTPVGVQTDWQYAYNMRTGWFQVLGTTKTNGAITATTDNQKEKGFVFGIESATDQDATLNTDFRLKGSSDVFMKIPKLTSGEIDDTRLKSGMQEFRKRVGKPIDMYYFYSDGIVGNIPKSNIAFTSSSYKIFSGNLILQNVLYRGNGILVIDGNLTLNGDIVKDLQRQSPAYPNKLKIYVTGNMSIAPSVKTVDAFIHVDGTLTTLSSGS